MRWCITIHRLLTASCCTDSMHVCIVLQQPARPGNVGAAARAMKTMGFDELRIVNAAGITEESEARAFAHASTDILDNAHHFSSLAGALESVDLAVATTGRHRGQRRDYYTPDDLRTMLADGQRGDRIAVVFGPEESGLSNADLALCQMVSVVPMRRAYPSLNLGQAVMVYTYALSPLLLSARQAHHAPARSDSVRALSERARMILPRLGFDPGRARFQRMMERLGAASQTDVNLLHSLLQAVEARLPDELPPTSSQGETTPAD